MSQQLFDALSNSDMSSFDMSSFDTVEARHPMALTAEQQAVREDRFPASFAPALMAGNETAIRQEWFRRVGHPDYAPEDLSSVWVVQLGTYLESFILDWVERKSHKEISRRGESAICSAHNTSTTLDGYCAADDMVIDAKYVGGDLDQAERYFLPQLIVQMLCTGATRGALAVCHRGAEPLLIEPDFDADYKSRVLERIAQFERCVQTLTPPVPLPAVYPPDRWRTINLDNPSDRAACNWSGELIENLFAWRMNYDPAHNFEAAKDKIKQLLPPDVGLVTFSGIAIRRARNNAVSVRYAKEAT